MKHLISRAGLFLIASSIALAQEPVPAGKGSYASFPPAGAAFDKQKNIDRVEEVEKRSLFLLKEDGRPIPSTKWYQNLIFNQYGTGLWPYPHKVDATAKGVEIFFPTSWKSDGAGMNAEFPLIVGGKDFQPADSRAKDWTDWTVSFRLGETPEKYVDVTLGEGMPYVWLEYHGVSPVIGLGGKGGNGSAGKSQASYFDLSGKETALPTSGDALGLTYEGRSYGIFAPDGTKFESGADGLAVTFVGKSQFLVVCPLPKASDLAAFHSFAYAVPRDTQLSWTYDQAKGTVSTHWKVTTEVLKGTEKRIIHGWLPHHYRSTVNDLALGTVEYATARGKMRCAPGNEFTITYPYSGIVPNLPAPKAGGANHPYDPERMKTYLATYFGNGKVQYARDTYSGGKDLVRVAQAALMAAETKDASFQSILDNVKSELTNWLTYTPGETGRYFACYPHRKGLMGFNSSYGSEHFTDNHFHYGYFAFAAGMIGAMDPEFTANYGEMARLVVKTYANWDRKEKRFPFFRALDIWRGHSFADGNGFPDGNNQESSSEAVQSWSGMILLGEALGDDDLTAAGVMGYTFETRATLEYWFNANGDVFPPEYKHAAAGMIWSNGLVWGTWFTASPAWIYGIQWIPTSPAASFFDRDPAFIRKSYGDMEKAFDAQEEKEAAKKPGYVKKPAEIKSHGGELGSYHLGYVMMADPQRAIEQLDTLWNEPGDKVAHSTWMANVYYEAHALAGLGRVDWSCHGSSATSMVYVNAATKARTFIVWNPTAKPETVQFYQGAKLLGKMVAAPKGLTSQTSLSQ